MRTWEFLLVGRPPLSLEFPDPLDVPCTNCSAENPLGGTRLGGSLEAIVGLTVLAVVFVGLLLLLNSVLEPFLDHHHVETLKIPLISVGLLIAVYLAVKFGYRGAKRLLPWRLRSRTSAPRPRVRGQELLPGTMTVAFGDGGPKRLQGIDAGSFHGYVVWLYRSYDPSRHDQRQSARRYSTKDPFVEFAERRLQRKHRRHHDAYVSSHFSSGGDYLHGAVPTTPDRYFAAIERYWKRPS